MNKSFVFSSILMVVCLVFLIFFPANTIAQQLLASIAFLLILPFTFSLFILKRPLKEYGFSIPKKPSDLILSLAVLVLGCIAYYTAIHTIYPVQEIQPPSDNFAIFFLVHILLTGVMAFLFDAFFRGFVQNTIKKYLHVWSILVQWGIFMLFLFATRSVTDIDMLPYIIFAPLSGYIAYRSNSVLLSFIFSWIFVIISYSILTL